MSQQRTGQAAGVPDGAVFPDLPEATVARLPEYLRALHHLAETGFDTVSSEGLAAAAGVNSAKLRKDLSHLGSYGTRGVGYDVDLLVDAGVTSILNFAPCVLTVPDGVDVRKVDLAIELQILSFHEHRKSALTSVPSVNGNGRVKLPLPGEALAT